MIFSRPRRRPGRFAATLVAVLAGAVVGVVAGLVAMPPAAACACGAVVTNDGVRVGEETALVRHDGAVEEITMGLTLDGEARDAAWLLPVPARPDFALAAEDLFTELARLTRPRVEARRDWFPSWSGGGDGGAAVGGVPGATVVERARVGPYDVATLAAGDGAGLRRWLDGHGYPLDPAIAGAAQNYAADGWLFVAVRLAPEAADDTLGPALPPLRVRFVSDEIVYPMRLTALATRPQSVRLYVLAEHRVRAASTSGVSPSDADLRFAGPVAPADVSGVLADVVDRPLFLTRFDQYIDDPTTVTDDYRFVAAGADTPYREVIYETEPVYLAGLPAGPVLMIVGAALLLGAAAGVAFLLRRYAARRPSRRAAT